MLTALSKAPRREGFKSLGDDIAFLMQMRGQELLTHALVKSREKHKKKTYRTTSRSFKEVVVVALAVLFVATQLSAAELKSRTLAAWDDYISSLFSRVEADTRTSPFLRISEAPQKRLYVQAGGILVWRGREGCPARVPNGLIHDWVGAMFIPKAMIGDVLAVTRDYNRYPEIYKPAVIEAKKLSSTAQDDRFSMLLRQKVLFVTTAIQGEYETRFVRLDAKRWYVVSWSTRLQAIETVGERGSHVFSPDHGPGYVWRLSSITKLEESDGGVYVEVEGLGLSRSIPVMLRWLIDPILEQLPRNSMNTALEETRKAVLANLGIED